MVIVPDEEKSMIERARAGDFEAFAALYSCYLDPIYRYIFFRTGDECDAEDFSEQVFLKAWQALPAYRPVGACFLNWLYRIAHNLVADHRRREKLIAFEDLPSYAAPPTPVEENALETIIAGEENEVLSRAISRLPEEYQQVIVLRFIEGLGHSEIAQILDKSEGACRGIQHRALEALSRVLSGMREWD